MRASEWICVTFLAFFGLLGLIQPIGFRRRVFVLALGITGIVLIHVGTRLEVVRDWIPALIMLFVYWQGGSFFFRPHEKLQAYLERFDERFFSKWPVRFNFYWEVAYLFCYPLVPGAIAVLYALGLHREIDFFWIVVLPPTLLCHLVVSFYQTYPPWKFRDLESPGLTRKLNFLVLRHASIQVNTFPSAHVASSMAIAFAMFHLDWIAGMAFLFVAGSITVSTVIGRYHYAADAILGFFLALGWYGTAIILL